jgi:hypothetical protein
MTAIRGRRLMEMLIGRMAQRENLLMPTQPMIRIRRKSGGFVGHLAARRDHWQRRI